MRQFQFQRRHFRASHNSRAKLESYNLKFRRRSTLLDSLRWTEVVAIITLIIIVHCTDDGVCDETEQSTEVLLENQFRPSFYQTETGFLNSRLMTGRHPNSQSSFLLDPPGGADSGHNEEEIDKFNSPTIWSDTEGYCRCWNSSDGGRTLEVECKCNGTMSQLIPSLPSNVHRIVIKDGLNFTLLKNEDLAPYSQNLKEISLTDLPLFHGIQNGAFNGMLNLDTIYIMEMPRLINLSADVFNVSLPKLKTIRISHSSLSVVPNLSKLSTLQHLDLVDLENNKIQALESGWVTNIQINYLSLSYNRLVKIGQNAFSGSTISRLKLKGNQGLVTLDPGAFAGIQHLSELDLSETGITHLPIQGLEHIDKLRLQNVFSLRVIPSIYNFDNLKEAWLTFPYHCCAFEFPETHNPEEYAKYRQEFISALAKAGCDENSSPESPPATTLNRTSTNEGRRQSRQINDKRQRSQTTTSDRRHLGHGHLNSPDDFDPYAMEEGQSFGLLFPLPGNLPSKEESQGSSGHGRGHGHASSDTGGDDVGDFHSNVITGPPTTRIAHCGRVTRRKAPEVKCHPQPDAFSPCEDIMGNVWLRGAVWIVVALALVGNTAVLVVLVLAPGRMSVQRFLMANLSFADLCMGIYLLMVATEDLISLGAYFNYAIDWQLGWGCQLAGFFTVFASELSVFTLAVITGERWYALTRALHLTKRLTIVKAAHLMSLGWITAIVLAALPLLGISSYSRTSICLPMEATTPQAVAYLTFILVFNGIAFSLVAYAYYQMYQAVAGHGSNNGGGAPAAHSADAAIAKKMALLVFTDFACWAPVAFFGLTAVAGAPLIGVTDSKILLVFFYPLNACCNPYLYAILTKQYRRDLLLLLSRHGICTRRAARYKTGLTGSTNNTMHTMQTILRLGSSSATETKMASGGHGRISVGSMGGHSFQSTGSSTVSMTLQRLPPGTESTSTVTNTSTKTQKPSVCSIMSIPERDSIEDSTDMKKLTETSFIYIPPENSRRQNSLGNIGKQKQVRISTSSAGSPEDENSRDQLISEIQDNESEATESTPFCI